MVLQNRLNYGFNGNQVPPTSRAARSAQRRVPFRKKVDDNQMCAFDLLATVAGKLLMEGENSHSTAVMFTGKEKCPIGKDSIKEEQVTEHNSQAPIVNSVKELSHAQNDNRSGLASLVTSSDCLEKFDSTAKSVNCESKIEQGNSATKVVSGSFLFGSKMHGENKKEIKIEPPVIGNKAVSSDKSVTLAATPSLQEERSNKTTCMDRRPHGSFLACRDNNVNLVGRYDDENSSRCIQPGTLNEANRPPPHIGNRRIRRLLPSKYWKVTPKLKDEERFGTETKSIYRNKVNIFKRQRSLRDYPFKKRRIYYRGLVANSAEGVSSDNTLCSPGKGHSGDVSGSVKLKIQSFRVPELCIEIPHTATVGSLKRTVMEAVTTILSGGLCVGVLLQGKKIRDDNKTLGQIGISTINKTDALSFSMEPNSSRAPPSCPEFHSFLFPGDSPRPISRYPLAPTLAQQGTSAISPELIVVNNANIIESDHDPAPSPPDMSSIDKKDLSDSGALVAIPETNEPINVVPMRKAKRLDIGHRRIRRPFSVSEVEALVESVELIGTGRWSDIKVRAFDNAKHRTYVDLKDKWKTLVHTARISPQKRRGEPVPQVLLDRVLGAHAFWSQNQAKQHVKQYRSSIYIADKYVLN